MPQHFTALRGQRDELIRDLLLSGNADLKHLLSFFTSRHPIQSGQAQRNASRILGLPHPVLLGHPEKRFDAIGADRQAHLVETQVLGRFKWDLPVGPKLLAHRG